MKRTLLALALFIGWAVLTRKAGQPAAAAYPFPTSASHDHVDLRDPDAVDAICAELGCSRHQLFDVASVAGTSVAVIRDRLQAMMAT